MSDLCRREGIKPHSYYSWTKEFMEAGRERLTRDTVRDATQQEVQALKRENVELNPNPPKDTDGQGGWREDSGRGWVRELQGRWPGVLG